MNIDHTEIFASLSNQTRLRCLYLAAKQEEVCVCEVVDALDIAQPTASKALKALREAGILTDRRDANWTYYRLDETMPAWLAAIVATTVDDLARLDDFRADEARFERSRVRQQQVC